MSYHPENPRELSRDYQITEGQLNEARTLLRLAVLELNNLDLEHEANDLTAEDLAQLEQRVRISAEILKLARLYFDQEHRWKKNDEQAGTKTPSAAT